MTHRSTGHDQSKHIYPGVSKGGTGGHGTRRDAALDPIVLDDKNEDVHAGLGEELETDGRDEGLVYQHGDRSVFCVLHG